jgi:hypothetical protein
MKLHTTIIRSGIVVAGLFAILLAPAAGAEPAEMNPEDGFVSMFNGKDLTGWEGSPGWWEVRDGLLVAESTPAKPCQRSHYLYWQGGQPRDFEMRASFRIRGDANSGIQFRSESRPEWDIWGYQADLDTAGRYTGCLYQHERGLVAQRGERVRIDADGKKTVTSVGDSDELLKHVRSNDWNDYRIRAAGPNITLWINGVCMCEVEDHQERFASTQGIIALQMHQGPPMKVEFKNLRIRMLNP